MSAIRFTSLGGVGEIGASAHLLEVDGLQILLDCGLHPKKDGLDSLPRFERLTRAPDAVVISHAHHDHCGSLPYLLDLYPAAVPYATIPTVSIMNRMLRNSVSVMGKIREEKGIEAYPLYDYDKVEFAVRRTYGIEMNQEFGITPKSPVRLRFSDAGHVLGSASVSIRAPGHSIFYTSDICTIDQELMPALVLPDDIASVDTLIIESTHGANEEADTIDYHQEITRFAKDITRVLLNNGTVLVPSFALGRSQEVLNMIHRLQESGDIPHVPVYASGLGRAVYEVYNKYADCLRSGVELTPLDNFENVGDVWDPAVARKLLRKPSIIVATSGMMIENTPSAMVAQELVKNDRNAIFFVGYCDPDTLGHQVKFAKKGDRLVFERGGAPVENRLDNIEWYHFSAHAPRRDLRKVAEKFDAINIVFVHGDPPALRWMSENCGNGCLKFTPEIGETIQLKS